MKRKNILDALNGIDFDMVEDAEGKHRASGGALWLRWVAVAACICLVIASVVVLPIALRYGRERWLEIPDDTTGEQPDVEPEGTDGSDLASDTEDTELSPGANGTGSADSEGPDSPSGEYVSSYELKTVGDQLYMVFDSYNVPPNDEDDLTDGSYGVTFDSVEDFQRGVIKDKYSESVYEGEGFRELTLDEMYKIVSTFTRDDIGVPIVDMYNLYLPDMPDGWELGWGEEYPVIDWRDGDDYVVYVSNPTENKRATFRSMTEDACKSELDGAKQTYGEPKRIDTDGKDIYVFDHVSASGTHTVTIYTYEYSSFVNEQLRYTYTLYGEQSAPSDEYLLSFDEKPQYAKTYELKYIDGQKYIVFDSYERYPISDANIPCDCIEGDIWASVDELRDHIVAIDIFDIIMEIKAERLTIKEIDRILKDFTRDENGIPIFDISNPYIPKLPEGWKAGELVWYDGCEYEIIIDEHRSSMLRVFPNGSFTAEDLAAQAGTLIVDGERTVLIQISSDVVEMKAVEGEFCYSYKFWHLEEEPTQEFLLPFGIQKRYVSDYTIEKVGEQWYLILDSYGIRPSNIMAMRPAMGLMFDSIAVMRDSVLNKGLTVYDLEEIIIQFTRDSIGIPIIDFYNLYELDLPSDWTCIDEVEWYGDVYYLRAKNGDRSLRVGIQMNADLDGEEASRIISNGDKVIEIFKLQHYYYLRFTEGDFVYTLRMNSISPFTDEELFSIGLKKFEE